MAKKEASTKSASDLLSKLLDKHDPKGSIIDEYSAISEENTKFVHTGNYMMNAHFSGSILKGAPMGKLITICGDPKAGKSFVLLNLARELQQAGYLVIYIETEFSHDKNRFKLQGIDTKTARITQPTTVEELIKIVGPLVSEFSKLYDLGKFDKIPKIAFIVDSRSGLLSQQQTDSFAAGEPKANFGTDIQAYDNFMKSISVKLGKLGWGFFAASHTKIKEEVVNNRNVIRRKPKGGFGQVFMSSVVSLMWKKDERDEEDKSKIIGINVTMDIYESRYCKHRPISFFLPNDRPMNPLDGLMEYVTWKICQIDRGKWIEAFDVRAKLITKKVITAETAGLDKVALAQLSKADSEFIDETIEWMITNGYLTKEWQFTKKYLTRTETGPLGSLPIHNPNSPKFIAAHLPNEYFTFEELQEDKSGKIFTRSILEKIDVFIRADFEIGQKSKLEEGVDENGEADYFAG